MNRLLLTIFTALFIPQMIVAATTSPAMSSLYKLENEKELKQVISETEKSDRVEDLIRTGIAYHNLSVLNVGAASDKSVDYLKKALELRPTDSIVMAYLGSATTMMARDSWNIFTKMGDANRGFNLLDKAVATDPENVIVRVIRINNSLQAPDFLGRKRIAKQDMTKLEQILSQNPNSLDAGTIADVRKKVSKADQ